MLGYFINTLCEVVVNILFLCFYLKGKTPGNTEAVTKKTQKIEIFLLAMALVLACSGLVFLIMGL